jgi:aryl-alcohol dehydrogenase-like predicted oxidoreductase
MIYNRTRQVGLKLPAISLGLWHNFGEKTRRTRRSAPSAARAFDLGITHFDLANNYGPPPGSGRGAFGEILRPTSPASRRADHLLQGRLRDVARTLWRMGQPQIYDRQPATRA